jgi:uncharacterized membrane protein YqiK
MAGETKTDEGTPNQETDEGQNKQEDQSNTSTYTAPKDQAELDRIINERLARERNKYKDYNDLKTKASKFDELTEAQKSELEKATGERDTWKSTAEANNAKALRALRKSAVVAEAAKQGAANPNLVFSLVNESSLEVDDDDNVSGVAEAVKSLLDNEPYLKGTKVNRMNGSDVDGGTRTGGDGTPGTFTRTQIRNPEFYQKHKKEILAAQKAGLITDE